MSVPEASPLDRSGGVDESTLLSLYYADMNSPLLTKDEEVLLAQTIEIGEFAREQLIARAIIILMSNAEPELDLSVRELAKEVKKSDQARDQFISSNVRLVVSVAKKYQNLGLELPDLIQEGNLGLMRAVEKFDWRKGFRFSTYATWWIRQALKRGVATQGSAIRTPDHIFDDIGNLKKARTRVNVKKETGETPSVQELADELGWSTEKVVSTLEAEKHRNPLSLDEALTGSNNDKKKDTLGDNIDDPHSASDYDKSTDILDHREMLTTLFEESGVNQRERLVLELRYGIGGGKPMKLVEIGKMFGLTRERIRQIEEKAFRKVRAAAEWRGLSLNQLMNI